MKTVDNVSEQVMTDNSSNEAAKYGDIFYNAAPGHMDGDYRNGTNFIPSYPQQQYPQPNPYQPYYGYPQQPQMPYNQQYPYAPQQQPYQNNYYGYGNPMNGFVRPNNNFMNPPMGQQQQAPTLQQVPNGQGNVTGIGPDGKPITCTLIPDEYGGVTINMDGVPLPTKDGGYTTSGYKMYNQQTGQPLPIGANPALQPQPMQQALVGNSVNNTVFNPMDKRINYVDRVVHVPGVNLTGNSPLIPVDLEKKVLKLQDEMNDEISERLAKENLDTNYYAKVPNGNGTYRYMNTNNRSYNYYYSFGSYRNIQDKIYYEVEQKYIAKALELAQDAMKSRTNFNKNISRFVHASLHDGVTEEQINRMYDGYTYTIPASQIKASNASNFLDNFKPLSKEDADRIYRYPYWKEDADITKLHNYIRDNNCYNYAKFIEERYHAMKKDNLLYNTSAFQRLVIRRKMERIKAEEEKQGIQRVHHSDIDRDKAAELPPLPPVPVIDEDKELEMRLNASRNNSNSLLYKNKPMQLEQFLTGGRPLSEYVKPSPSNPDQTHLVKRNIPFAEEFPELNECSTIDESGMLNVHLPDYLIKKEKNTVQQEQQEQQKAADEKLDSDFFESIWRRDMPTDKFIEDAKRR